MRPYVYVLLAVSLIATAFLAGSVREDGKTGDDGPSRASDEALPETPGGETGDAATETADTAVEDAGTTGGSSGDVTMDNPPGSADGADPGVASDYHTPGESAEGTPDEAAPGGNFQLLISDAPADISDFDSLNVTLSHARVHYNGTNGSGGNCTNPGWEILDLNSTVVDLTQLVGNKSLPVLNATLKPGNYTKIEMYVEAVAGIVNGSQAEVKVPGWKLKICMNFTVVANQTTMFVFDMHVVKTGNGRYNIRPVITESGVVGKGLDDVVIVG
jgi:hypothetical protein